MNVLNITRKRRCKLIKPPMIRDCPRKIGLVADPWTMRAVKTMKPPTKRAVGTGSPLMALNSRMSIVIRSRIFNPKKPTNKQMMLETKVLKSQRSMPHKVGLETAILSKTSYNQLHTSYYKRHMQIADLV